MRTIRRIIVHHTASPDDWTLEKIDRSHLDRGFSGVGYHFVIEATGLVRLGRPVVAVGAHAKGANRDSIGVCLVGAFHEGGAVPSIQWAAAVSLVRDLMMQWSITIDGVIGHCETKATLCPGFDPADFRAAVVGVPIG
jgi:N-acetyl-anhydromuramyl-L-alanine amidase AmpD